MSLYPKAPESGAVEEAVNEIRLKEIIVEIEEEGCTVAYAAKSKNLKEGDDLSRPHVTALAVKRYAEEELGLDLTVDSLDLPQTVRRCYEEIHEEQKAMGAISPAGFSSKAKYLTALDKKATVLKSNDWYNGMLDWKKVTTWADLKAACTPENPE